MATAAGCSIDNLAVHFPITIIFDEAQRLSRQAIKNASGYYGENRSLWSRPGIELDKYTIEL